MLQNLLFTVLIFLFSGIFSVVFGQTTAGAIKPSVITGDVASVSDKKIVVNSKSGVIEVAVTDKTEFKRVPPENPILSAAIASELSDIGVGDKLLVTGILASDGKSIPARAVYLMTKSAISQKNAKEAAEWRTRGIAGKVVSVNTQTNQINIEIRTLTGSTSLVLTPKNDAAFLRYAPDSERFNEAKPSSLAEVKAGDMIRALGDKSSDGTAIAAEKVLTGAFQTVAGTVVSIDEAKNEVVIKNLQTKKDITIQITETSLLKKYPAEMAERMAGFQAGAGNGPRPIGQGGTPAGQGPVRVALPPGQGQMPAGGPGRGGFAGPSGGVDEMLDRFPTIKAGDLKVGDMIAVSSTKNTSVDRIRAIKLLAGVEPFLRMAQAANGRGRGGQGVEAGFTIPGLDGVGFP
ncbi:MAG: hypothetical protein ACKVQJ_04595 [Pyrinomonadaceae bacterium]